jgi:hypothetical protein
MRNSSQYIGFVNVSNAFQCYNSYYTDLKNASSIETANDTNTMSCLSYKQVILLFELLIQL